MGNLSPNFDSWEFECPCCKRVVTKQKLIDKLEAIREKIGNLPIYISSGYRCKKYNASIGGYPSSPHITGEAVDIKVKGKYPVNIALEAEKVAGIRIGIYPNHTHIDIVYPSLSRFWLVKKYGDSPIYSREEKSLIKFLEKEKYI